MATAEPTLSMSNRVRVDPETGTVTAVRKLRESGNSTVLTIPPQVLEGGGFEPGEQVRVVADMEGGGIRIETCDADDADDRNSE